MNTKDYPYLNLSLEDLPGEIWKPVPGYTDFYEISNLSRIKSLSRVVPAKAGGTRTLKEKILRQSLVPYHRGEYFSQIFLYKDGIDKGYCTHKLVAQVFVPNPQNFDVVQHKDGDILNNVDNNLIWRSKEVRRREPRRRVGVKHYQPTTMTYKETNNITLNFATRTAAAQYIIDAQLTFSKNMDTVCHTIQKAVTHGTLAYSHYWKDV